MKHNLPFLKHIQDEINFILKETEKLSYRKFLGSEVLKRAIARSIEIIGEASKKISNDFKRRHKDIPWKELAGIRDKIIHFYFGIKWDIVWSVIKNKIPELKPEIEEIIEEVEEGKYDEKD